MYYLGITLRVEINSKIGTSPMYMLLLTAIKKNLMCIIFKLWMIHKRLFDLKRSLPQSESQDSETVDDQIPQLPLLFLDNTFKGETTTFSSISHPYNTRPKNKTATACRQAVVEIQVTYL